MINQQIFKILLISFLFFTFSQKVLASEKIPSTKTDIFNIQDTITDDNFESKNVMPQVLGTALMTFTLSALIGAPLAFFLGQELEYYSFFIIIPALMALTALSYSINSLLFKDQQNALLKETAFVTLGASLSALAGGMLIGLSTMGIILALNSPLPDDGFSWPISIAISTIAGTIAGVITLTVSSGFMAAYTEDICSQTTVTALKRP